MTSGRSFPPRLTWEPLLEQALREDIGRGDLTSLVAIEASATGRAQIESRAAGVVCGLPIVVATLAGVDPALAFEAQSSDGDAVPADSILGVISGPMRSILTAERTLLNFLGRMCGIATHTRLYVEAVAGTRADIVDTRKTLPGWRVLDKYAAATGGAVNHRMGLDDGILLKDNHIAAAGSVAACVKAALSAAPAGIRVQVEVESMTDAQSAIDAGADFLLLDNQSPQAIREMVDRFGEDALLEASGGITLENVRRYAETGVHRISIGALTHSAPVHDVALEIVSDGVSTQ